MMNSELSGNVIEVYTMNSPIRYSVLPTTFAVMSLFVGGAAYLARRLRSEFGIWLVGYWNSAEAFAHSASALLGIAAFACVLVTLVLAAIGYSFGKTKGRMLCVIAVACVAATCLAVLALNFASSAR